MFLFVAEIDSIESVVNNFEKIAYRSVCSVGRIFCRMLELVVLFYYDGLLQMFCLIVLGIIDC